MIYLISICCIICCVNNAQQESITWFQYAIFFRYTDENYKDHNCILKTNINTVSKTEQFTVKHLQLLTASNKVGPCEICGENEHGY